MSRVASKILRILLVFSLTFMLSWHLEYEFAYGAGSTGLLGERAATTAENPTFPTGDSQSGSNAGTGAENGGTTPDSPGGSTDAGKQENGQGSGEDGGQGGNTQPSQPEQPASYAYVKTIEILVLDKDDNRVGHTEDPHEVEVDKDGKGAYEFHAKVVWVPDSNNPEDTKEVVCTPKEGLSKKTNGALGDLVWEIFIPTKNDKGEIQEEKVPESQAQFKKDFPGVLEVYALDLDFSLRVYSDKGQGWIQTESRFVPDVVSIKTIEEKPEDENESSSSSEEANATPFIIYYDANGGTGDAIEPSQSDTEGTAVLAENAFTAPNEKEFGGWNTRADGTGTLFAAGSTITSEQVIAAVQEGMQENAEAAAATADGENRDEGNTEASAKEGENESSTGLNNEGTLSLTLYAIWAEPGSSDSGEMTGNALVRLSYIPAPLGQNATLSPVLSNVGHITFAYVWELSTDGGTTWEYAPNDNIQTMLVPTTAETIGWQYRVSVYADRTINPDDGSNKITSEPVTIREANDSDFTIVLSYEPVVEGDMAHFSVTSSDLDVRYEWQESTDGGASWKTISGVTTPSYSIPTDESHMGNWYRAKAKRPGAGSKNICDDGIEGDECACDPDVACSNVQMLVALAPDAEPIVIDDVNDYDPTGPEDNPDANPGDETNDTPNSPDVDNNTPDQDSSTPAAEDFEPSEPASPTEPNPAPEQQPSEFEPMPDQPTETSTSEFTPIDNLIVDPEVSEKLTGEIAEQEPTQTLGSHWRKLSVIPQQEEIQAVLEDNPFAPLVMPLAIALIACGMTERFLFFRRQTKDTGAAFV